MLRSTDLKIHTRTFWTQPITDLTNLTKATWHSCSSSGKKRPRGTTQTSLLIIWRRNPAWTQSWSWGQSDPGRGVRQIWSTSTPLRYNSSSQDLAHKSPMSPQRGSSATTRCCKARAVILTCPTKIREERGLMRAYLLSKTRIRVPHLPISREGEEWSKSTRRNSQHLSNPKVCLWIIMTA